MMSSANGSAGPSSASSAPKSAMDMFKDSVTVLEAKPGNNHYQCLHCSATFRGSMARVVAHLASQPGKGVKPCSAAPDAAKLAATAHISGSAAAASAKRKAAEELEEAKDRASSHQAAGPGPQSEVSSVFQGVFKRDTIMVHACMAMPKMHSMVS